MMHLYTYRVKLEFEDAMGGVYGTDEIAMGDNAGDELPNRYRK